MMALVRLMQPEKAMSAMVVTLSGMVTLFKLSQFAKAILLMEVTLFGRVTFVRLSQSKNARSSMDVTLLGMAMFSNFSQSSKALSEIVVIPFGRVTDSKAMQLLNQALVSLDPRDVRYAKIVEQLGGFRQVGKLIPAIQQFANFFSSIDCHHTHHMVPRVNVMNLTSDP